MDHSPQQPDAASPPREATTDDHVLATWLAEQAGHLLLEVRRQGLEGRELKDAGDAAAHELLMRLVAEMRPDDAVLSEEGKDDKARLTADRVWIIDPLDGTREFSEPPRDDWAVHVALWQRGSGDGSGGDGDLVAGAVAQPALGETFSTGGTREVPPRTSDRPRIAVSRALVPRPQHRRARQRVVGVDLHHLAATRYRQLPAHTYLVLDRGLALLVTGVAGVDRGTDRAHRESSSRQS